MQFTKMIKFKRLSSRATLTLINLMDTVAASMLVPHLNAHAKELGFSEIQLGLAAAAFTGCQLLTSPTAGSLSDIRGRKPIIMLCFIFCSISFLWLGLASSVFMFIVLRVLLGMFNHTEFLIRALAPDYITEPTELSSLYGRLMSISNIGMGLGTAFSGIVMDKFPKSGFTIACAIITVLYAVTTVLINKLPEIEETPEINEEMKIELTKDLKATTKSDSVEKTLKEAVNKILSVNWIMYWDIVFFIMLMTLTMSFYYNNFDIFLKTKHNVSPKILGYITTMQRTTGDISNNLIISVNKQYVDDKDSSERIMHIFVVIAFCITALSSVSNVYRYMLLVIPKSMIFSVARLVTLEAVIKRSEPGSIGTLLGVSNSVKSATDILAPIMSSLISQYLGVYYVYYTGATFALIGAYVSYRVRSRSTKEKIN